jgi:magnesium-transporting ATPase (P-type)
MWVNQLGIAAVDNFKLQQKPYLRWLTLFLTSGTLLCCALPILLVSMGFGAIAASLNYNVPGLLFLVEHKFWTLSLSALLLIFLAWVIWRPNQACPTDPELAAHCQKAKRWNKRIFWLSVVIWVTGFFFSALLLPIRQFLNL